MPRALESCLLLTVLGVIMSQAGVVEITSEPSHHLVFQNEWVRVFNVRAPAKASTLVHRHNYDYAFVTLGDTDITNSRVNEAPVEMVLQDGETRFTKGGFAHSVTNNSDHPFHNITIELLKPSTAVHSCNQECEIPIPCASGKESCASGRKVLESDQWTAIAVTLPPGGTSGEHTHYGPHLAIAVTEINLKQKSKNRPDSTIHLPVGGTAWIEPLTHTIDNLSPQPARLIALEFKVPPTHP
jgi:quercetin dioxygenase-like cupin family protein